MANLRLLIEVLTKNTGDLRKLNGDLKRTGEEAEKTGSKISGMGKALGAFATGFVAFKALDFLSDATNAAAEFNDTVSASGVILGEEALPELEAWADGAARAFGASKQEALDAANTFAVFGKSAGLAGEDLTTFSTDLTELAGDLASFRGGTTEEAIEAIGSALRGEQEPIRRYGVLLDDATLRQRALRLGIIETTSQALTPQQKVLAAQAEIFEQTADAQGDYARTADDMANVQRTLAAEFENVTIEVGEKLLPVLLELATWIRDDGIPLIEDFVEALGDLGDRDSAAGTPFEGIEKAFNDFADSGLMFRDFLTGEGDKIREVLDRVGGDFWDLRQQVKDSMSALGIDFDSALALVEKRAGDHGIPQAFSTQMYYGIETEAKPAAEALAAVVPEAIEERFKEIRDAAFQSQVEYAKGLRDGQNEPLVQMEALQQLQEESLTVTAEIARLKGQLASESLASGLSSAIPAVRAQAEATRLAIVNQLATLGVDASNWGYGVAASLASGLNAGYGLVINKAGKLAAAVRGQIGIESEPDDASSPLRGITKWGENIARTLAEGMSGAVSLVSAGSRALASAIAPDTLQGFSVAPGAIPEGGTGTVGAGGIHIHLYNMGDPIEEDDDVLESLRLLVPHIRDAVFSNG